MAAACKPGSKNMPKPPPGLPAWMFSDTNPNPLDPVKMCTWSKLDPKRMARYGDNNWCARSKKIGGPKSSTGVAQRHRCTKVGRMTNYGQSTDPMYSNPCHAMHCHMSYKSITSPRGTTAGESKTSPKLPKGALPVALSTKYVKTFDGIQRGHKSKDCSKLEVWGERKSPGACGHCVCVRVSGVDRTLEGASTKEPVPGRAFLGMVYDMCNECADESLDVYIGNGRGGVSDTARRTFPELKTRTHAYNRVAEWQFAPCSVKDCDKWLAKNFGGKPSGSTVTADAGSGASPPPSAPPGSTGSPSSVPPPGSTRSPSSVPPPDRELDPVAVVVAVGIVVLSSSVLSSSAAAAVALL